MWLVMIGDWYTTNWWYGFPFLEVAQMLCLGMNLVWLMLSPSQLSGLEDTYSGFVGESLMEPGIVVKIFVAHSRCNVKRLCSCWLIAGDDQQSAVFIEEAQSEWQTFCNWVSTTKLGGPKILECEKEKLGAEKFFGKAKNKSFNKAQKVLLNKGT